MLQFLFAALQGLQQRLPLGFEFGQVVLNALVLGPVLFQLLLQFQQAFLVLLQFGFALLLFFLQWCDLALQLQPALAALALLFHPGAGAPSHVAESTARHFDRGLGFTASLFGSS